ncbi:MAG: hypothetical protein MT490_00025 [Sphingomonas sp.]|uniref:hypothetical protein n=1 Tax=Sphingomonas sp. TaxID=28214 RepID=UPI0022766203|nr:hypothetical protein [Sphingomonas sp.]MCX8474155.1 hypothetical protein [Sphingomonas sp.]
MGDTPNLNESNNSNMSEAVIVESEAASLLASAGDASQGVKLNFINLSNDANNSEIVIFGKNVATSYDELAIAWTVIKYCGQGDNHPFTYPMAQTIGASDSWGNYTPQQNAPRGQRFAMALTTSGDQLVARGPATSPTEIQLLNELPRGAVNANIYKDGRLFAIKTSIAPQQMAVFDFTPTIWIGVASQVQQGQVMNSAIISNINTEISLLGLVSADIVMTGGGSGPNATAFVFTLENVVMA